MQKIRFIFYLLSFIFYLSSCMDDNLLRDSDRLNVIEKTEDVFIINEGNFTSSNASLSYYKPETGEILNNIFYNTNALPLGDVAQSMTIIDSTAYIVLNNSGKIYVINTNTFKYIGKITGLTSPRYIHFVNKSKAYISDMYAKAINIVNPTNFEILGEINVNNHSTEYYQHSTEQIVQVNNYLFVSCWSYDNKVLVIDPLTDKLIDSIEITKQPNSLQIDKNNKLWVLSDGGFGGSSYEQETAALTCINTSTFAVEKVFKFPNINLSPTKLQINSTKDTLFYISGNLGENLESFGVFRMPIENNVLPQEPFIKQKKRLFYGLGIDPNNSDIYVSDAIDHSQNGYVLRFSSKGEQIDSFKVGIIPSSFCFK